MLSFFIDNGRSNYYTKTKYKDYFLLCNRLLSPPPKKKKYKDNIIINVWLYIRTCTIMIFLKQ
jgi:hypothetical protein